MRSQQGSWAAGAMHELTGTAIAIDPVSWREPPMSERDPIDLIREQLSQLEGLAGLAPDHDSFRRWFNETQVILEKAFTAKSIHCQSFLALRFREVSIKGFASQEIDKINTARYRKDLDHAKTLLQGSIKELTLDRTLFKKIQTTPQTVNVRLQGEYLLAPPEIDPATSQAVRSCLEGLGLTPVAEPESSTGRRTFAETVEQIRRSRIGLYDFSGPGRIGALLGLGAALVLGKRAILLCPRGTGLPEVLEGVDRIEYEKPTDLCELLAKKMEE
jgi:hypothetical protein